LGKLLFQRFKLMLLSCTAVSQTLTVCYSRCLITSDLIWSYYMSWIVLSLVLLW